MGKNADLRCIHLGSIHKFHMWYINEKCTTLWYWFSDHCQSSQMYSPLDKGINLNHLSQQSPSLLHRDPLIILCARSAHYLHSVWLHPSSITQNMMLSWHGKLFHITELLWKESPGWWWFPYCKGPMVWSLMFSLLFVWTSHWTSSRVASFLQDVGTRHYLGGLVQERCNSSALAKK